LSAQRFCAHCGLLITYREGIGWRDSTGRFACRREGVAEAHEPEALEAEAVWLGRNAQ
jgi:hypothetical protein